MDAVKLAQIVLEDRHQWQLLVSTLDAHAGQALHGPPANPWKSQDVYAHLARWLERSNRHMINYVHDHTLPPDISNPDDLNALWKMQDRKLNLPEARQKARQAFEERIRILHSIPLEKWDFQLENISRYDGSEHYQAHRNYIQLD